MSRRNLPVQIQDRGYLQVRRAKLFVRNEKVFRGYRKFQAESQIKFAK